MIKFFLICLLLPTLLFSAENKDSTKVPLLNVIVGKVQMGPGADSVSTFKFEAAFNLALGMSQKYRLISMEYRDSVINAMQAENQNINMLDVAKNCNADVIAVANIGILKHMMRVELTLADITNKINYKGIGYDLLHYRKLDEKPLYDPALVKATQRAISKAIENDNLYENAPEGFNIRPAAPLVVGGIEFINEVPTQDSLMTWDLFDKKIVNSFDLCETVFEKATESNIYAAYDLDSRDSLYAMLKLFGTENYTPPSSIELFGLAKIEVEYYISGKFTQLPFAARLELVLYRLNAQGGIFEEHTVKGLLKEDNIDELRKLAKKLTGELLDIKQ